MIYKPSIIIVFFLAIFMLVSPLSRNADSATIAPSGDIKLSKVADEPSVRLIGPFGRFIVEVEKNGKWEQVWALGYSHQYADLDVDLSKYVKGDEQVKVRLRRELGGKAHIESVYLGSAAPASATGLDADDIRYISKNDHDVVEIGLEKPLVLTFTKGKRTNATFRLRARVEPKVIPHSPFLFPLDNINWDDLNNEAFELSEAKSFYSYKIGANPGRFGLKGDAAEVDNIAPLFKEWSISGSGHPDAYTFGWVRDDGEYLYAVVEFSGDNTRDGAVDYAKVRAVGPKGEKTYKLTEVDSTWGRAGFGPSKRVKYRHKYYEFKVPLADIGAGRGDELKLAFSAYGTNNVTTPGDGSTYDFGNVTVNTGSTVVQNVVHDDAGGARDIDITIATGNATMFSVTNNDCTLNSTTSLQQIQVNVPTGVGGCNVNLTFTPTSNGAKTTKATYDIAASGDEQTLNGTGVGGVVTPPPTASYTLSVHKDGSPPAGMGNVYSDPSGIDCPGTCSATFDEGTEVTLYTKNTNGMNFFRWEDDCADVWRGAPCVLSMTGDSDVGARFYPPATQGASGNGGSNSPPVFDGEGTWLLSPVNGATGVSTTAIFIWANLTDPDGNPISYEIWFCDEFVDGSCSSWSSATVLAAQKPKAMFAGFGALGGVVLIGFLLGGGMRTRGGRAFMLALFFITAGFTAVACSGSSDSSSSDSGTVAESCDSVEEGQQCQQVTGLTSNTTYHWKLVASDGAGGTTDSDTWSFTTGE
ncbi:hypothetical protein MNBD_NITROSPINAE03-1183 [hydrothermal vent metagenome]|uniref:Bacterial repeat domain-containing protein n=1 Tax=hydrothermal vent metagenome TaxID=652676 RepID=A0A3B1D8Z1_9ZZZZ